MKTLEEDPDIEATFWKVVQLVRDSPPQTGSKRLGNEEKLLYYGLYKHITQGPCPPSAEPSRFHVEEHAKFMAYLSCRGISKTEAMEKYVDLAASQDSSFGEKCRQLLPP